MKKSILSISVAAVFSLSALNPVMVAAAPCAPGLVFDNNKCVNPSLSSPSTQMNSAAAQQAAQRKAAAQKKARAEAAKRRAQAAGRAAAEAAARAERQRLAEAQRGGVDTTTSPPTSAPSGSSADDVEAQEKINKLEKGNIVVITYADDPQVDKQGNKDHRIGNVSVKVERTDGDQKCTNRKGTTAKTNGKREMKDKDGKVINDSKGKPVLFKGTLNYRMCNAGKYKATLIGRDGYSPVGKTSVEFNLKNNETQTVKFVIKKNAKTKKTKTKSTTLNSVTSVVASRLS